MTNRLSIFPTALVLPGRRGFTLWGGNVDGTYDYLLTRADGTVLLAGTPAELWRRLPDEAAGPLAGIPGFHDLAKADPPEEDADDVDVIDFVESAAELARGADGVRERGGVILDCLNVADDLARQVGDAAVTDLLRGAGRPLAGLYSYIWKENHSVDWAWANADFGALTTWFVDHLG